MHFRLKRAVSCAVIFLLLVSAFHITASAADKSYQIEELGMSITLPDNISVITRQTKETDTAYAALGYTYEQAQKVMKESDIYLKGVPKDASYEVEVYMVKNEHSSSVYNLKLLSEKQLAAVKEELEADENCTGCTLTQTSDMVVFNMETKYEIPAQDGAKPVTVYSVMSYTVINGMQVSFSLRSLGSPVTVAQHGIFSAAASSITFDEILTKPLQVDMLGIILTSVIAILVIVALAAVILLLRGSKKRRNGLLDAERRLSNQHGPSPLRGFYDELEQDGLLEAPGGKEKKLVQNEGDSARQPIRVTVEVPVTTGADDNIRAVDETKDKKKALREDEADSVELTRSNNEDYDEAAVEDNIVRSSKLRIFVGGAGSKIKNSVSSIGDILKSRQEIGEEEVPQEQRLDDYDPLSDVTYEGVSAGHEKQPLPDGFEKEILQARPEPVQNVQKQKETDMEDSGNTEEEKDLSQSEAKPPKREGRAANSNARESFRQVAGSDKALGAFESDSYWDKYR